MFMHRHLHTQLPRSRSGLATAKVYFLLVECSIINIAFYIPVHGPAGNLAGYKCLCALTCISLLYIYVAVPSVGYILPIYPVLNESLTSVFLADNLTGEIMAMLKTHLCKQL